MESTERERDLARQVFELARAELMSEHQFLTQAMGILKVQFAELPGPFATDGTTLYIDAEKVLTDFRRRRRPPTRDLAHVIAHCLLLHPLMGDEVELDQRAWAIASDVVAEGVVRELCGARHGERGRAQGIVLARLEADLPGGLSTASLYRQIASGRYDDQLDAWEAVFRVDDTELWFPRATRSARDGDAGTGGGDGMAPWGSGRLSDGASRDRARARWSRAAARTRVDLETTSSGLAGSLGGLVRELSHVGRSRQSLAQFLRAFGRPHEVMRVSDDEFDYAYYTYGLALFGDMPLIEQLEYREESRLREFVVVLDTSGSVWGPRLVRLVRVAYAALSAHSAEGTLNIHLLQVDDAVRRDTVISTPADIDRWAQAVRLRGGGGTDFRPAFDHVEGLRREGGLRRLEGLLYLTDGRGTYPGRVPDYPVAFVFLDAGCPWESAPPWAMVHVLDPEDDLDGQAEAPTDPRGPHQ